MGNIIMTLAWIGAVLWPSAILFGLAGGVVMRVIAVILIAVTVT